MFRFGVGPIEGAPAITILHEPLKAMGLSTRVSMRTVYKDVPRILAQHTAYKERHGIPDLREPWAFIAVSKDFDPQTQSWDYAVGDVVTSHDHRPEALTAFEAPAGTYVVFRVRPRFRFLQGWAIGKTKRYVVNEWFPRSEYEPTGIDFEYNDPQVPGPLGLDLYFAARKKT